MAASSYDQCCTVLKNFLSLCEYLGVPIAPEKTVGPETTLTFAGIELDTRLFEARLPADKIAKSKVLLSKFLQQLSLVFRSCGLDSSKYKSHSFCIGAATFAADCGFSDTQIRLMGRWKSDASRKYIRMSNITTSSLRS